MTAHRSLRLLRGPADETAARAARLVSRLAPEAVLWVGDETPPGSGLAPVAPKRVGGLLGRSFDAVVLDLHAPVDAGLLGQAQGFVWGGGALIVRAPPAGAPWPPSPALCLPPFTLEDVGARFATRVETALSAAATNPADDGVPLAPTSHAPAGTPEQAALVEALTEALASETPSISVVLADRGRGKSAALGLALRALVGAGRRSPRVVVTASTPDAAAEVLRFAGTAAGTEAPFVPLTTLLGPEEALPPLDVLVVDEAASLPVPVLQRLVQRHPHARMAFATTTRGYEGTGRGFVLRFLAWARAQARPVFEHALSTPIRWAAGDPLETHLLAMLALDAGPAEIDATRGPVDAAATRYVELDRDLLARDEPLLREVFGLLVHAHYRTTPGDLHRALDAPNLSLHALLWGEHVVAAALMAREGGLPPDLCDAMAAGRTRVRGHALADTLVTHGGHPEAGGLSMARSVRIATHPGLRRLGLARRLVECIHAALDSRVDLIGTVFGATPELLAFRRALGYRLVRVGVSRGTRTGEPAAVMVRPATLAAHRLVDALLADLAWALPTQLALQSRDELVLDEALVTALMAGPPVSPAPAAPTAADVDAAVAAYLGGPAPCEGAAWALGPWVRDRADALRALSAPERALISARLLERRSWAAAAKAAGYSGVPAAMRALRPALRALAAQAALPARPDVTGRGSAP
jgi:tRNA(Met) cytidine acetyltransferase